ncbi:MAG: hypothetical protein ACREQ5_13100 [Candidatus Dormibacteria bacterium]
MAINAAAGYPQYSGNLITPLFSMELLELFYCTTVYGEISTTEYSGELERYGDQITFWREPEILIRDYEKGGPITHDTIDSQPITMTINNAKDFSIEISQIDEKQIENWPAWRSAFLRRGAYNLATSIDTSLLSNMFVNPDPANQGTTAGVKSGAYNLGTTGAPAPVTSSNITQYLSFLQGVLDEQCAPRDNRYVVVPPIAYTTMLNSDLRAAYLTGMDISPMINGRLPPQVAGFNVYVSNFVPQVFDVGAGANVWEIVAGYKGATAFAAQIDRTREIEGPDSWNRYYQGLAVYGFQVLYPKGIAALYAKFS